MQLKGFARDDNGAIINKQNNDFEIYKRERARSAKGNELENRIEKLEKDISQIKNILQSINSRIS